MSLAMQAAWFTLHICIVLSVQRPHPWAAAVWDSNITHPTPRASIPNHTVSQRLGLCHMLDGLQLCSRVASKTHQRRHHYPHVICRPWARRMAISCTTWPPLLWATSLVSRSLQSASASVKGSQHAAQLGPWLLAASLLQCAAFAQQLHQVETEERHCLFVPAAQCGLRVAAIRVTGSLLSPLQRSQRVGT